MAPDLGLINIVPDKQECAETEWNNTHQAKFMIPILFNYCIDFQLKINT